MSACPVQLLIVGQLQRSADALALLRAVRAGEQPRIHPGQPIVTLGADDELTVLRAYESGSDHHLADDTGYVLLRAVLAAVMRRTIETVTSRHLHVAGMHIDVAARTIEIAGTVVCLSPIELELLVAFEGAHPCRSMSASKATLWRAGQPIPGRLRPNKHGPVQLAGTAVPLTGPPAGGAPRITVRKDEHDQPPPGGMASDERL